jgi:hypothetical protein
VVKKNVEFHKSIVEHDLRERKVQLNSTTEWKAGRLEVLRESLSLFLYSADEILDFRARSRLWRNIHRCVDCRRRRSLERRKSYPSLEG